MFIYRRVGTAVPHSLQLLLIFGGEKVTLIMAELLHGKDYNPGDAKHNTALSCVGRSAH
jgi:hypothetical protein